MWIIIDQDSLSIHLVQHLNQFVCQHHFLGHVYLKNHQNLFSHIIIPFEGYRHKLG